MRLARRRSKPTCGWRSRSVGAWVRRLCRSARFLLVRSVPRLSRGTFLTPKRNQPRNDNHQVNLAEERLQHGERLPHTARWNEIAITNRSERGIAEEQVITGCRLRQPHEK